MSKIGLTDYAALDATGWRKTSDGYLTATARVARTGIQEYLGVEVGRPDMKKVRVYRPPSEVFSDKAMHSFAHRPMTMDHPNEFVTSKNWRKYAIGQTGDEVVRDGQSVRVPLVLMDSDSIAAVESGERVELSMGYVTDLKWEDGETGTVNLMTPFRHLSGPITLRSSRGHVAVLHCASAMSATTMTMTQSAQKTEMTP
jgi:hypothetical protein